MTGQELSAVTGVGGFSGKYIARRLIAGGGRVLNLTGHPDRPTEFGDAIESKKLAFNDMEALTSSLRGVSTLYNTYWIRFERGGMTFHNAVGNSGMLIAAARDAGVERIVHISITNPSLDSPLPYFQGKALVENYIERSGIPYAILRPATLFGDEGILINNIAWFLRHTPVFGVPGDGKYQMQPIHVDDLARLAVEAGQGTGNTVRDAIGPEAYAFNDLLRLIRDAVQSRALIMHLPPQISLVATGIIGRMLGDVVLTRDEVLGLRANLLASNEEPNGTTHLSDWLRDNASWLGTRYFSEVNRHFA